MARMVNCVYLGNEAEGLDFAPYPGDLGKRIYDNVSKEAWQKWVRHQTMLINEYRLTPIDPRPASSWKRKWKNSSSVAAPACRKAMWTPPSRKKSRWMVPGGLTKAPVTDLIRNFAATRFTAAKNSKAR